ncbi:hypothetical protein CBS101457_001202 [Exobasidium rhododendri]|nr:hypothetical protein CBS101457_001202 [Exobasidium rhododendri]
MSGLKSPAPTLSQLKVSLKNLRKSLDPVIDGPLEALTLQIEEANQDGKLQSAQLYVSMAYVVLDLVWILLKVSGIDPVSHPVTADLQRVQEYLTKVHNISKRGIGQADDEKGADKPAPVDHAKVARFLRHALGTAASGKRTIFADDGSVERIVDAGTNEEGENKDESNVGREDSPGWEQRTSKQAKRQTVKAEKALRKASKAIESSKKRHRKAE